MTNFGHRGFKPFQEPDLTLLDFGQFLIFDDFGQKHTDDFFLKSFSSESEFYACSTFSKPNLNF